MHNVMHYLATTISAVLFAAATESMTDKSETVMQNMTFVLPTEHRERNLGDQIAVMLPDEQE
jgi:hypothetical protein